MALTIKLLSWKIKDGDSTLTATFLIEFQIPSKYFRSHCSSISDLSIPAVLIISPISAGISRLLRLLRVWSLSLPVIFLETPPPLGLLGIRTMKRPARLI